jgi:hypothetical protein
VGLRPYLTFPTLALKVGPDWSRVEKATAWAAAGLLGSWLGYVWFLDLARAAFVLNGNDNVFGMFVVFTGLLIIPMVVFATVLPLVGGIVLSISVALSILFIFPASHFAWQVGVTYVAKLYGPALLVGLGFFWSAQRATTAGGSRRW